MLEAGEDDFDEKRLTERFVGLVFGWDGQQYMIEIMRTLGLVKVVSRKKGGREGTYPLFGLQFSCTCVATLVLHGIGGRDNSIQKPPFRQKPGDLSSSV